MIFVIISINLLIKSLFLTGSHNHTVTLSLAHVSEALKAFIFAYDVTKKTNQQPDCIKSLYIDHIKDQIDRSRDLLSYAVGRPNSSHSGTASKEKLP